MLRRKSRIGNQKQALESTTSLIRSSEPTSNSEVESKCYGDYPPSDSPSSPWIMIEYSPMTQQNFLRCRKEKSKKSRWSDFMALASVQPLARMLIDLKIEILLITKNEILRSTNHNRRKDNPLKSQAILLKHGYLSYHESKPITHYLHS